jgi:hypothetical protein
MSKTILGVIARIADVEQCQLGKLHSTIILAITPITFLDIPYNTINKSGYFPIMDL